MSSPHLRRKQRGSSSQQDPNQMRTMEEKAADNAVTEVAMQTWEFLQEFPGLRDRVIADLKRNGAKVEIDNDAGTITKIEIEEDANGEDDW